MGDVGGLAEHDGGRAILVGRQFDRALDLIRIEAAPGDDVFDLNACKYPGLLVGPLGLQLDDATLDRLAAFLQDVDDVIGRAAAHAEEQHLQRPHAGVVAAGVGVHVHDHRMAGAGAPEEGPVADPADVRFQGHLLSP